MSLKWRPSSRDFPNQEAERRLATDVTDQLVGKVGNRQTGWEIEITKRGLGHAALRQLKPARLDVARLEAIAAWKELLERAQFVESRPSRKGVPEIKNIHQVVSMMRLGDSTYTMQLTVKEYEAGAFRADDVIVRRL